MSYTIENFRVESGQYVRPMMRMFFGRNWPWFILPLVACAIIGAITKDFRWLIVGLMLVFMVFPMVVALIYFSYALTLETRWSLMEKTATFDKDGIGLTFVDSRMKARHIKWTDITHVTRNKDAYFFHLKVRRYNFLMIPRTALQTESINESDWVAFIQQCIENPKE